MKKKIILGSVNLSGVTDNFEWYPIVVNYNMEEKYIENVMNAVAGTKFEENFAEYYIPIKYILDNPDYEEKGSKPKIRKEKGCYAGYVFIRCKMNELIWNLLRTTTGASVILTTGGTPTCTSDEEIKKIKAMQAPVDFSIDEAVKLLVKLQKKYVKIVPGENKFPDPPPEPDERKIMAWYMESRQEQKQRLEEIKEKNIKENEESNVAMRNKLLKKAKKKPQPQKQQQVKKPRKMQLGWKDQRNKFGFQPVARKEIEHNQYLDSIYDSDYNEEKFDADEFLMKDTFLE